MTVSPVHTSIFMLLPVFLEEEKREKIVRGTEKRAEKKKKFHNISRAR